MKKLLLVSALALLASGAMAQEATEETLKFALENSYRCDVPCGYGTQISFTQGYAEYILLQDYKIEDAKYVFIELEKAKNVNFCVFLVDGSIETLIDGEIEVTDDNMKNITVDCSKYREKTGCTLKVTLKENTGKDDSGAKAVVKSLIVQNYSGDKESCPSFVGSKWGGTAVAAQKSGTVIYKGNWGGINIVDAKGNELEYDPSTGEKWQIDIEFVNAIEGELCWEFKKVTAESDFYGAGTNNHIKAGAKSGSFVISPEYVTGTYNTLYLKADGSGTNSETDYPFKPQIKSITLTRTSTALRPIYTSAELLSTEYFSITGTRSLTPHKGFNIVRRAYSDGSVVTEKSVIK